MFLLILLVCGLLYWGMFSGSGGDEVLKIQTLDVVGELELEVPMQPMGGLDSALHYQELSDTRQEVLDSLIIDEVSTDVALAAYVQQSLNQLKLYGYQIGDEVAKKSILSSVKGELTALLKTYTIVNMQGVRLYMAQYAVELPTKVVLFSYATDVQSHRKAFIRSLDALTF